jgi:FKBP-type peptidyl-prolyl cis-trans isomerase
MKRFIFLLVSFLFCKNILASNKDSLVYYALPDSMRAVSFLVDVSVSGVPAKKETKAGIQTSLVKLYLENDKGVKKIEFEFSENTVIVVKGIGVEMEKGELNWKHHWSENENYRLMIATAGDSAGNFSLYSGYIFLPKEKKWKLLGTCKIEGQWSTLKQPAVFYTSFKNAQPQVIIHEAWCQRSNGSWKNLLEKEVALPVVNLLSHADSLQQTETDKKIIESAIEEKKTDVKQIKEGVYYAIVKEGIGRQVTMNDTVVVHYKGYLFSDGSVFDQTKDKPAIFPLSRLIVGWQTGLPLCKVGGKIKLIIPSHLAYSIRTRSAKIPPNSILVFVVEVVDVKSPH